MKRTLTVSTLMAAALVLGVSVPAVAAGPKPVVVAKKVTTAKFGTAKFGTAKFGTAKSGALARRGIIVVGGRYGNVALNPQPLPPKARIIFLKRYGDRMLNPQPLPPRLKIKALKRVR